VVPKVVGSNPTSRPKQISSLSGINSCGLDQPSRGAPALPGIIVSRDLSDAAHGIQDWLKQPAAGKAATVPGKKTDDPQSSCVTARLGEKISGSCRFSFSHSARVIGEFAFVARPLAQ
jgi:hypothetical protein